MLRAVLLAMMAALVGGGVAWAGEEAPPEPLVRLRDIAPTIRQDIRYAGSHNFVVAPVEGYRAAECLLTRPAADALRAVQADLAGQGGYGLIVFDCYRPRRGVAHFVRWAADPADDRARAEFYPRIDKRDLFRLGYIAEHSSHSRGSTVDLTLTGPGALPAEAWRPGQPQVDCAAPYGERFRDGGLDLGTGYDCFDDRSLPDSPAVSAEAQANRRRLAATMAAHGFRPITSEYWHFTLAAEPYPDRAFDLPVE